MKKSITFEAGKFVVQAGFTSRHNWNHFKIHKREGNWHLVWGKLSISIEDWTLEIHALCAECGSPDIGGVGAGDESWTVCQSCRSIEQGIRYVNLKEYERVT